MSKFIYAAQRLILNNPATWITVILGCFLLLHHGQRTDHQNFILSDGKGYYSYLPALFIFHDPGFSFTEQMEEKYYDVQHASGVPFMKPTGEGSVNKYFPGLAILWLPFFLLAHVFTLFTGLPPDGYSALYQWSLPAANLTWLFIGLHAFFKLASGFGVDRGSAILGALAVVAGTNMLYYITDVVSMSHIYSFSLLNLYSWMLMRTREKGSYRLSLQLFITAALIIAVRPLNVFAVILLSILFYNSFLIRIRSWFRKPGLFVLHLLPALLVLISIPLIWFWQTGNFIVYSYGDEGFNFLKPEILNILFSTHHGWLLYSPVCLFAFPGLIMIHRQRRRESILLIVYLLLAIYLLSSWWSWWYGSGYGNRAFIDHYGVIALGISLLVSHLSNGLKWLTLVLLLFFTTVNWLHLYQYRHGILPDEKISARHFFSRYFSTLPLAIEDPALHGYSAFSGKVDTFDVGSHTQAEFIPLARLNIDADNTAILVKLALQTDKDTSAVSIVAEYLLPSGQCDYIAHYPARYLRRNKHTEMEFLLKSEKRCGDATMDIYIWNPGLETLHVDLLEVTRWNKTE